MSERVWEVLRGAVRAQEMSNFLPGTRSGASGVMKRRAWGGGYGVAARRHSELVKRLFFFFLCGMVLRGKDRRRRHRARRHDAADTYADMSAVARCPSQ